MDFNQIKKIIRKNKGKIIVMEGEKPVMVILSYEEYMREIEKEKNPNFLTSPSQNLKEDERESVQPKKEINLENQSEKEEEDLTIDDLPL